jgi:hypothetical protein
MHRFYVCGFVLIGIVLIGYSYHLNWNRFYKLTFEKDHMYLQYYFPYRVEKVDVHKIKSLKNIPFGRLSLTSLQIEERNGKVYMSSEMQEPFFGKNLSGIKDYIKVKNGFKK